jgi:hypothetical protein
VESIPGGILELVMRFTIKKGWLRQSEAKGSYRYRYCRPCASRGTRRLNFLPATLLLPLSTSAGLMLGEHIENFHLNNLLYWLVKKEAFVTRRQEK